MMKFLLSLDYELFFGTDTGSVQKCLVEPVAELLKVCAINGLCMVFFVDAGFLRRLREEGRKYRRLQEEYDLIRRHLEHLVQNGHDIQLHIHPHWQDCYFDGEKWKIDTSRYKLHDFDQSERREIVHLYKRELIEIAGDNIFAFRGGGWCIQPFHDIADILRSEGIWLESTVFFRGKSEDSQRGYDFSIAPDLDHYRFSHDPVVPNPDGNFVEVPISSIEVGPFFFWKMVFAKKLGGKRVRPFGDGSAMVADTVYYLRRLTGKTRSVVSIDGMKAGLLEKAIRQIYDDGGKRNLLHAMGHPKALTPYSITCLATFLNRHRPRCLTFQDLKVLAPQLERSL